ncbi:MAG TPA: DUF1684 domain-containing protein [Thermomonas sp.]|nr:DUF1684 domain-containing protein [Thermomonas sp.]
MSKVGMALACVLAMAGCEPAAQAQAAPDEAALMQEALKRYAREQFMWRGRRVIELSRPDGWTSLVGLHWLDPGTHRVGSDTDNGIRLAMGPDHLGVFTVRDGTVRFVADSEALTVDGQPSGGAVLRTDKAGQGPSVIGFDAGKGQVTVIERGGRLALRVKHADADSLVHFAGLEYWTGGRDWQLPARFIAHPKGKTLPIANIIGTIDDTPNPGVLEFQRGGKTYRLEALDQGEDTLFVVFADRTSGHGSYGAGRFLDAPKPDAQGRVLLDFNQAYNPPCAFTPFATCPLPPPENRLDLAVQAGEKAYAKPASQQKDSP